MSNGFHSSGDVIADRRAQFAKHLAEGGDPHGAADVMGQAIELAPLWVAGWDLLGRYCEMAGDLSSAIAAWRHLEALDDEGLFGAQMKLAAHGAGPAGTGTAVSYVEALFDQYAPKFEHSLVEMLGYNVPAQLNGMIETAMAALGIARFEHALDLGCGTGLMGEQLRGKVDVLDGIDLSAAMIAETRKKGIYDHLAKAELVDYLRSLATPVHLMLAADVLIYCGALPPVLGAMVAVLRPGGLLGFSLEAHDGDEPVFLRASLRYAHGEAAARQALADAGLDIVAFDHVTLRRDRGVGLAGMLVLARKPG